MAKIKKQYKYHYFYKITNLLNEHYYYGIHSTNDLNDGYMGSGSRLKYAFNKYGVENFKKEILKYFDTREELANYESEIVGENLIHDLNCYNISYGGETCNTLDTISVIDENGNKFRCKYDDPKYLSGEWKGITTGLVPIIDIKTGKKYAIPRDEYYNNKDKYKTIEPRIYVKYVNDNEDNFFLITKEEYKNNKDKYITLNSLYVNVKDKEGNIFRVRKNDPRYLSGELKFMWCNMKFPEEAAKKLSEKYLKSGFHKGQNNPMYNTCWISDIENKKSIKISNDNLNKYLQDGWIKGRKFLDTKNMKGNKSALGKSWMYNEKYKINKLIKPEDIEKYIELGWIKGRKQF